MAQRPDWAMQMSVWLRRRGTRDAKIAQGSICSHKDKVPLTRDKASERTLYRGQSPPGVLDNHFLVQIVDEGLDRERQDEKESLENADQ